ncbi:beta-propeller domain-containing protein, partial [Candidatus Gracilibacteria bacterium]|nr:beta-propeller domain-containing protein [Candidatus Gracilibacteria bacterium]
MKYLSILSLSIITGILSFTPVFGSIEDDSILTELEINNLEEIEAEAFTLKSFASCEDLETVTSNFLKNYKTQPYYRSGPIFFNDTFQTQSLSDDAVEESVVSQKSGNESGGAGGDFSGTNEQVAGVSESEIIKTDGEYIYYIADYYDQENESADYPEDEIQSYQDRQKKDIYIVQADTLEIVKKIALPKHFWGTQLYLQGDTLVILATGQPSGKFQAQYWDNSQKTYTIIYDVANPAQAELKKVYMSEGSFSKSRLIDNTLYVISQKNIYSYLDNVKEADISAEDIIPKGLEIIATDDTSKQNVDLNGKTQSYNVVSGYVSQCDSVEYILPDADTDLGYPAMHMISTIDISDITKPSETKLLFGNIAEVYMSLENLYITSRVHKTDAFRCGPNMACIAPWYFGGTNHTLIHKLSVADDLSYQTSALVSGNPLTQYSMDEYQDH